MQASYKVTKATVLLIHSEGGSDCPALGHSAADTFGPGGVGRSPTN
jgi:hypothetical protein